MPFSTTMSDLRIKGQMMASWNQEFVINEKASVLLNRDNVILFEILDFSPDLVA